mgnify:CR=1 FL=1
MNSNKIKFGIAPINWSNDDMPELGGDYDLDTILSEMSEAGYVGTELGNKFPKDAHRIKKKLNNFGLELASSWHSTLFIENDIETELDKLKQKANLLVEVGAKVINIAECSGSVHGSIDVPISEKPICSEQNWASMTRALNLAGKVCKEIGLDLSYHHHIGTCIESEDEINKLLLNTDPNLVNLCADTGHLYFAGIDPVDFYKKNMKRIKHIHFKDLREDVFSNINFDKDSFLTCVLRGVFTVPGDGCIDYYEISKTINDAGYKGWIIIEAEQDPVVANPLEYAKKSKKYLNMIWSN